MQENEQFIQKMKCSFHQKMNRMINELGYSKKCKKISVILYLIVTYQHFVN